MLADPAPPMTSADDLLSFARRGRARHRARLGVGFAAAATLAIAAAAPLLIGGTPATRPPIGRATQATSAAPAPVPVAFNDLLPVGVDSYTPTGGIKVIYLRTAPDAPVPTGDLCQAPLPMEFKVAITSGPCEVITLQGVQIRLGSYRANIPNSPEATFALRYLEGKAYICLALPAQAWDSSNTTAPTMTARELADYLLRVR
ncbi:hypothetical protein Rhe02_51800 [Rhizocola hellebori]|uniref:Uncharacterized protein n=2 Tax=Rhizocola hellebori TaxID=1392758 RepID=A0A8J3QAB8_9ACTN|nr:hypothetical protein Rhe02_51800 [Rhizocola hellebori]